MASAPKILGKGSVTECLDDQVTASLGCFGCFRSSSSRASREKKVNCDKNESSNPPSTKTWEPESVYSECARILSSMYTTTRFVHEKFCKVSGLMKKSSYESLPSFGTSALPVTLPDLRRLDENTATRSFPPRGESDSDRVESDSSQHWLNLSPEAEAQLIATLEEQVETCESLKRSCDKYAVQLQQDLRLSGDVLKALAENCRKAKSRMLPPLETCQHSVDDPHAAIPTTSVNPAPEESTAPPSANDGKECSNQESEIAGSRVDQGPGTSTSRTSLETSPARDGPHALAGTIRTMAATLPHLQACANQVKQYMQHPFPSFSIRMIVRLQAIFRGFRVRRWWRKVKTSVLMVQRIWRGHRVRKGLKMMKSAATVIMAAGAFNSSGFERSMRSISLKETLGKSAPNDSMLRTQSCKPCLQDDQPRSKRKRSDTGNP